MALTWKQVAAPDLSAGRQGYETFSNLLNTALSGGQRALGKFDADISERVNNELALKIMQYSDPEKLKADAAAGILVNPGDKGRVSAETLRLLSDHPTQLLNQQETTGRIAKDKYTFDDLKRDDAAGRAAAPLIAQASRLITAGDDAGAQKLMSTPEAMAKISDLDPNDQKALFSGLQSLGTGFRTNRSSDQTFDWNNYLNSRTKMSNEESDQLSKLVAELTPEVPEAADYQKIRLGTDRLKNVPPRVLLELDRHFGLNGGAGGTSGGGTSGAPGAPGSTGSTGSTGSGNSGHAYMAGSPYNAVFGHGAYGLPDKPVEQMSIGEAVDYGRQVLIPATKGKINKWGKNSKGETIPLGTSAIGGYQFTQETLQTIAPIVFKGQPWQTLTMNSENQDKMARYLFEKNKGGNLQATWEGLPDATPGAYKDLSFDQIKPLIFKKEAGMVDEKGQTERVVGAYGENFAGRPEFAVAKDYLSAALDTNSTPDKITADLIGKGGKFANAKPSQVDDIISQIMRRFKVSAPVAGFYARMTVVEKRDWLHNLNTPSTWGNRDLEGSTYSINWKEAKELDKQRLTGYLKDAATEVPATERRMGAVTTAQSALDAAEKILLERKAKQAAGWNIDIGPDILRVENARAALKSLRGASMDDPSLTNDRRPAKSVGKASPVNGTVLLRKSPEGDAVLDRYYRSRIAGGGSGSGYGDDEPPKPLPFNIRDQQDSWKRMGGN